MFVFFFVLSQLLSSVGLNQFVVWIFESNSLVFLCASASSQKNRF